MYQRAADRPATERAGIRTADAWPRTMADTTTTYELLVTTFATADALAKLLIEKGLITQAEFMEKLSVERATYQKLFNPTPQ